MSSTENAKNDGIVKIVKFAIMMALMVGIGMLEPFGQITPMGMKVLGVFVGTLFGWMFLDFIVSSTVGLVFLGLSGYTTVLGAFQTGISDMVVMNMLIAFAFVALLDELNLTGAMANWLLGLKFVNGRPWMVVALLFFAAFVIAAFADTLAAILLFWSITYKIAEEVGYEKRGKDIGYLLVGIIFFAAMGAYLFPFKPGVLAFAGGYVKVMGEIPQGPWYFGFVFLSVFFFVFYLLVGKLTKFDVKKMDIDLSTYAGTATWGKREKWGLVFMLFFVVLWQLRHFCQQAFQL